MNASAVPDWEVYAVRYASLEQRLRSQNFIARDEHDGPMPMDYYVWLLRAPGRIILVDTGFGEESARRRDRRLRRCPIAALASLGVAPADVTDVIITHLHYDHAGNLGKLPGATFHIQDAEVAYATGRCMCHEPLRHAYDVRDVTDLIRHVYEDRVVFHDGDAQIAPGVAVLRIGGHTGGLQAVRVQTARGCVVLASDASHYYENMEAARPFPIVLDVAAMLEGHRRLRREAESPEHVIPGHDPLVLHRYPQLPGDAHGIALLHRPPLAGGAV
jgi:glyoxylase-like metal-dependent hydrolase (beta-lactamase superfamily II)